jgi:hypothetical protein
MLSDSLQRAIADKPSLLYNLGTSLFRRFELLSDSSDVDAAMSQFSSAACFGIGSTSVRFQAASSWAICAQLLPNHSPLDAYAVALQLLPELAWLGLSIPNRHHHLLKAGVVVRDAVAAAITAEQYDTAIEWLEQGHSIVWAQLLQLRTPIADLQDKYPSLANELKYLSRELEGAGSHDGLIMLDLMLARNNYCQQRLLRNIIMTWPMRGISSLQQIRELLWI